MGKKRKEVKYVIERINSKKMDKGAFPLFWLYELYDLTGEATIVDNGVIRKEEP